MVTARRPPLAWCDETSASGRAKREIRTPGLTLFRRALYQLSYQGVDQVGFEPTNLLFARQALYQLELQARVKL